MTELLVLNLDNNRSHFPTLCPQEVIRACFLLLLSKKPAILKILAE